MDFGDRRRPSLRSFTDPRDMVHPPESSVRQESAVPDRPAVQDGEHVRGLRAFAGDVVFMILHTRQIVSKLFHTKPHSLSHSAAMQRRTADTLA